MMNIWPLICPGSLMQTCPGTVSSTIIACTANNAQILGYMIVSRVQANPVLTARYLAFEVRKHEILGVGRLLLPAELLLLLGLLLRRGGLCAVGWSRRSSLYLGLLGCWLLRLPRHRFTRSLLANASSHMCTQLSAQPLQTRHAPARHRCSAAHLRGVWLRLEAAHVLRRLLLFLRKIPNSQTHTCDRKAGEPESHEYF